MQIQTVLGSLNRDDRYPLDLTLMGWEWLSAHDQGIASGFLKKEFYSRYYSLHKHKRVEKQHASHVSFIL